MPDLFSMKDKEDSNLKKLCIKNYYMLIPVDLEPLKEPGVYFSQKSNCKICIQITDEMPLNLIGVLGDRQELKYYCQLFLDALAKRANYWIISSNIYSKRLTILIIFFFCKFYLFYNIKKNLT